MEKLMRQPALIVAPLTPFTDDLKVDEPAQQLGSHQSPRPRMCSSYRARLFAAT